MEIIINERGKSTEGIMSNLDFLIIMGNANNAGIKRKLKNDITPSPPKMPEVISIKSNTDNKLPKPINKICRISFGSLLMSDSFVLSEFTVSISFGFIYISTCVGFAFSLCNFVLPSIGLGASFGISQTLETLDAHLILPLLHIA